MKKTLFVTMLAAALMGGQAFAENVVYKVSDYDDKVLVIDVNEATIIIDASSSPKYVSAAGCSCLTLDYQRPSVLKASNSISMPNEGVLNITSTVEAVKTKWEKDFSVEGGGIITLCWGSINPNHGSIQFFGTDANNTVKLGNTDVKFMGVVDNLKDLGMNQVGVAWSASQITLVGKVGSSPVPEPTTGTLGLLALAGLAARRRKP